jgi:PAS domain S-box-containing protein
VADEVHRLRLALRDLVALSTIPAAWVGKDATSIAAGLADVLGDALHLDFVFVRLSDVDGCASVDVTRGAAWKDFPLWLERNVSGGVRPSRWQIVPDVNGAAEQRRGLVTAMGFDGVGGLVAVASDRADFPTEIDQLLLSVAANHAAMAFQSARLVEELRRAEEDLRRARDDLELKVAERTAELRRTSAELQTILDASPVGMVLVREDHTVQRCNSAFERLVGWTAADVIGRRIPVSETIEQRYTSLATQPDRTSALGFSGFETRMTRKDGSAFDAALACAPLTDELGRPAGLVANIEDISDRKRAEEALRKAEIELAHVTRITTLGELVASIAHEINQPLTAIVANAAASLNWLAKPDADLEQVRGTLADIVTDGHRAGDVIQRIRQLATKSDPRRSRLALNEVIDEAVMLVRNELQKQRVSLRVSLASGLPAVRGDRVQLQQVIINLVMNGIEAMGTVHDRPRELMIRSEAPADDRVLVTVQDTGVGLDLQHIDRLFDAFFTTKPAGMGMGLSISRSIIEGHGGRLWATPNTGCGAMFRFALPVMH